MKTQEILIVHDPRDIASDTAELRSAGWVVARVELHQCRGTEALVVFLERK